MHLSEMEYVPSCKWLLGCHHSNGHPAIGEITVGQPGLLSEGFKVRYFLKLPPLGLLRDGVEGSVLMSLCGDAVALDYRAVMLCHVGWLHTSSKGANEVSESSATMLTVWKALWRIYFSVQDASLRHARIDLCFCFCALT